MGRQLAAAIAVMVLGGMCVQAAVVHADIVSVSARGHTSGKKVSGLNTHCEWSSSSPSLHPADEKDLGCQILSQQHCDTSTAVSGDAWKSLIKHRGSGTRTIKRPRPSEEVLHMKRRKSFSQKFFDKGFDKGYAEAEAASADYIFKMQKHVYKADVNSQKVEDVSPPAPAQLAQPALSRDRHSMSCADSQSIMMRRHTEETKSRVAELASSAASTACKASFACLWSGARLIWGLVKGLLQKAVVVARFWLAVKLSILAVEPLLVVKA